MIDGTPVVDATVHGYNIDPSNFVAGRAAKKFAQIAYVQLHSALSPRDGSYRLTLEQFERRCDPAMLASALFAESQTDLACYHAPGLYGFFHDGGSPIDVGVETSRMAPGRMYFYGALRPFDIEWAKDDIDRQVEEYGISGLKLYPNDLWQGKLEPIRLDDEDLLYPLFEHALSRGITNIAMHKAVVLGPAPLEDYRLHDVDRAALAFRKINFEIVHAGWAFLEDTAMLAECFPNVWLNLEGTSAYLNIAPARFGQVIGSLLAAGAEDRILWATGAMAVHPRPLVEKFWDFEIDESLANAYGYGELTKERKAKILGGNFARLHGIDLDSVVSAIPNDEFRASQAGGMAAPWSRAPIVNETLDER